MNIVEEYDFLGVGLGPSNLSLAALNSKSPYLSCRFFDRRGAETPWHEGLLFPESRLQTHFLKDLVSPVDPTNPFSFTAFLLEKKCLYQFLTSDFNQISRKEFSDYLLWATQNLPGLDLNTNVERIRDQGDHWELLAANKRFRSRSLVVATGRLPNVPDFARKCLGSRVFHASQFNHIAPDVRDKRIAIVGSGQSGAEILYHLLLETDNLPREIQTISRRGSLLPLDDSPFVNEFFTPSYSNFFSMLDSNAKAEKIRSQVLASDGVSMDLLNDLYQRIYELRHVLGHSEKNISFQFDTAVIDLVKRGQEVELVTRDESGLRKFQQFDLVILATGFRWRLPEFLSELGDRIEMDGQEPRIRSDFSAYYIGPEGKKIFFQNAARQQRGVADSNLSLLAWRSAVILNSLSGRPVYDNLTDIPMVDWANLHEINTQKIENVARITV